MLIFRNIMGNFDGLLITNALNHTNKVQANTDVVHQNKWNGVHNHAKDMCVADVITRITAKGARVPYYHHQRFGLLQQSQIPRVLGGMGYTLQWASYFP